MTANYTLPPASLVPVEPAFRSHLDSALKGVSNWSPIDRDFFVAAFTTRKTGAQHASEIGLSPSSYISRRRDILRRFMRAGQIEQQPIPATD